MTGFASVEESAQGMSWVWEIRCVNARGLDVRLRLPDRAQTLEPKIREKVSKAVRRGSVQVSLRLKTETNGAAPEFDQDVLAATIETLNAAREKLEAAGLPTAPVDPAGLLSLPGISVEKDMTELPTASILAGFDTCLAAFVSMRADEGGAMAGVVGGQIDNIGTLVEAARDRAGLRATDAATRYREQVAVLVEAAGHAVDAERLSHDLAALTVKGDVSEEIDRLVAHVAAARSLLQGEGPLGRKLDFLTQEFNREANTLCSKSSDTELTQIGLELKVVIDQMREQVQNLE